MIDLCLPAILACSFLTMIYIIEGIGHLQRIARILEQIAEKK